MAKIRIDLTEPLLDGMDIKFKAPCDCTAVTGMVVYYPAEDDSELSQSFVFKDVHGNVLTGMGNLFIKDTYVKVIVDTVNGVAYFQNADTNGYIEQKFNEHTHDASSITGAVAMTAGGTGATNGADGLKNLFAAGATVLSANQYGDTLPSPGTPGRVFFKKVSG